MRIPPRPEPPRPPSQDPDSAADTAIDAAAAQDAQAHARAPKARGLPEGERAPGKGKRADGKDPFDETSDQAGAGRVKWGRDGVALIDGRTVSRPPRIVEPKWRLVAPEDQLPAEDLPLPKDVKGGTFLKMDGRLTVGGIQPDDVIQNSIGDCYFLASLSAVAHVRPELIERMVKDHGDGTYSVTFHDPDTGERLKPIRVDTRVPFGTDEETGERAPLGAQVDAPGKQWNELWPAVVEKAYAVLRGGYRRIDSGGNADEALPVITGANAPLTYIGSYVKRGREDLIWKRLVEATENGWPACSSTPVGETEEEWDDENGIVLGHVYTILGAYEKDGEKFVRLRNPHAKSEPGGETPLDGKDDGVFDFPFESYLASFEDIAISKLPPRADA